MEDKYVAAMRKYHEKECSPVFFRHFDRGNENYSNTDIDPDRTDENYNLAPDHGMDTYTYYRQEYRRLENEGALIRPDLVTCAGWIVTLPQELKAQPRHIQQRFFKTTYEFLCDRYGAPDRHNILSANVHNDETTPHMHFMFMPTAVKNGVENFQAKYILNRYDMSSFHPDLQEYLNHHGVMANVNSGITKAQGGNKTIEELKAMTREHEKTQERTIDYTKDITY